MAKALDRLLTIEDWLAYEGEPGLRYELVDGRLVAMNPPRTWHGAIANRIGAICDRALEDRPPCRAIQGAGLEIRRTPKARGYIPDIVVTCEPMEENRTTVAEPRLVIEILSPSTGRFDKAGELQDYMMLPSVEEIWLVGSENRLVLQAICGPEGWGTPQAFIGRASLSSPVLGVTITLDEIYRTTPLAEAKEPEGDFELP